MKEELEKHTIEELTDRINKNPEDAQAYYDRGEAYFKQEKYEEVILDCDEVIKRAPYMPGAYINKGVALVNLKKHDEALSTFNTAIEKNNKNFLAYFNKADVLNTLGRYEEAISNYNEAIKLVPKFIDAYFNRGKTFYKIEEYEKAITDYNEVIKQDSKDPAAYILKGIALRSLERYEEANTEFDTVIDNDKTNHIAYTNRANISDDLGKYDEAISDYEKAIEIEPNDPVALINKGLTLLKQHKCDKAISCFNKAIKQEENNPDPYYYKGLALKIQNKYDDAILPFKKTIALDSKYTDAYSELGDIYYSQMEYEKAAKTFVDGGINLLGALGAVDGYEKLPNLLLKMLDYENDEFFNTTIGSNLNQKEQYKHIYISTLQIIKALHVNSETKISVAHYTKRSTAAFLLFEDPKSEIKSKFRLNSVITANDPQEGKILIEYLLKDKSCSKINLETDEQHDYQAFIGCFTFNQESLNQFRLYGKEADKEATGVSLVLNNEFFNDKITTGLPTNDSLIERVTDNTIKDSLAKKNSSTKDKKRDTNNKSDVSQKNALFRCIYFNPKKNKIVSLGHEEDDELNELQKDIETKLKDLRNSINAELNKPINNDKDLHKKIICELLLPLRYLVKHAAFKEEQECRIFEIKDLKADKAKDEEDKEVLFTPDYSQMYIEYQPITDKCLDKIIFAPKANGVEIFKKAIAQKDLDVDCFVSTYPFA